MSVTIDPGSAASAPAAPATAPVAPLVVGKPIWPVIPLAQPTVTVGRLDSCTVPIQHASISRSHVRFTNAGGVIEIEDLDSRFGTFVNGARVKKTVLKLNDTVRIGSSPPYRFTGAQLEPALDGSGMAIRFGNISIERDGRKLIEQINFSIQPDTFVGVLGPSGAGKSLMLGTLSSTITPTSGQLEFDDGQVVKDNIEYYRSKLGIVTQDDIVYTELTVYENLEFAALIRLPDMAADARAARVTGALEAVGLLEHRDKKVGVLSGGQRKRVSVAIELLLQPRLLLLDEPTSGLDPGMQARLMEMLRGLSRRGVTIVCTTHTLDTMHFFDQVIVLGLKERVANVVYHGGPNEMLDAFGVRNQADLFDKLQQFAGMSPAEKEAAEAAAADPATDTGASARRRGYGGSRRDALQQVPHGQVTLERRWQQAQVVLRRSYLGLVRDKMAVFMALFQPLILAILVTLSQANQFKSLSIIFFTVICTMWLGMTLTVREIVKERKLYIRDRIGGMHPDAYLLGKFLYAGGVVLVQATIMWWFFRIVSPILIRDDLAANIRNVGFFGFFLGWFIMIMTGLGAAILGLFMSTVSKSERAAITLLPLLLLPQVVLSRVVYGDIRKEWREPSAYLAMGDFLAGKPMGGMSATAARQHAQAAKLSQLYDLYAQHKDSPAFQAILAQNPNAADLKDIQRPPMPPAFKEPGWLGRSLNFLISVPMLSRPASASLDMLSDRGNLNKPEQDRATAGLVFVEVLYLIALVGAYGAGTYYLFRKLERGWNDIRSA